ncbi:MATE family efflux transporter [Paracrocinitomix mangrovi]|uniref:MATE family efflux transporter n=1 Tax=Paracrocinitomix mangrovi TaxID=2862509 RepID=UPI001C8DDC12|nr:MATE family efflux transporter [Paracrocinitomix mangrovi]UKN02636.1 MATE family efflux transporter [Paracrocinitomix mangrovi]
MLELSYKRILIIALPLMFGTFVQSVIAITDGAFVSELGNTAYTAVGNGSLMYMALFMLCRGLADGAQITIAKKYGEQKFSEIGLTLFNAQFLQILLTTLIFAAFQLFADILISSTTKSVDIGTAMSDFIHYRSWGIFFAGLQVTMIAFFIGLGKTRIIITSTLIMALTNILLDYGLIFGKLGLPQLGMKGAPIASSIAEAVTFFFLLYVAIKGKAYQQFNYNLKLKLNKYIYLPLIKLSYPLMFQGVVSLSTWWIFFSMIEHLGTENLEVAHNIRYMYFIAFVPIFGFASATRTYVSNLVGREEQQKIPSIQFKIGLLSFLSIVALFHGSVLYPEWMIQIVERNPTANSQIIQDSVDALRFVSGSIVIFAVVVVLFHSVSALGKTMHSFIIELISILIYLVACYLFIEKWKWDIVSIWWVEYIYFIALGIGSGGYLIYYFRKRQLNLTASKN